MIFYLFHFNLLKYLKIQYLLYLFTSFNLNNYLLTRDKPLSISELKEILFQLNNIFKKLNEVNIINIINI